MRQSRIHLISLFTILFSISSANAALLIEPLAGYNGVTRFNIEDSSFPDGRGHGGAYGGRLGYQNLGFQLGIDYLRSGIKLSNKSYKENFATSEWGAFVGYRFPVLLRIYAGYIFAATAETKYLDPVDSTTQKLELSDGSGGKIGIGFTGLPLIDLNLEYRRGTFGEYKYRNATTEKETTFSSYMISVSLPIVL